jgi:hypothetical protein
MNFRRRQTIAELLHDPLIQMVMRADHVDPRALERDLKRLVAQRESGPARTDRWARFAALAAASVKAQAKANSTACGGRAA